MADNVFNIAKGKVAALHDNVEQNSPSGCTIGILALVSTNTDDEILDTDTITALLALGSTAEVTNGSYARKVVLAAGLSTTVDDTNNWVDLDIDTDPVWTSIDAGDDWTHLVIYYDPDGTDTDTANIPLTVQDFVVSPNGGHITGQIAAAGYYRAQ